MTPEGVTIISLKATRHPMAAACPLSRIDPPRHAGTDEVGRGPSVSLDAVFNTFLLGRERPNCIGSNDAGYRLSMADNGCK